MCNTDWGVVTNNLQVIISSLLTNYYLSAAPNLSTIVVTVNGVTVPESATNGWSYHTGTSSSGTPIYYLQFNGSAVPSLYSTINVSFTPATAK